MSKTLLIIFLLTFLTGSALAGTWGDKRLDAARAGDIRKLKELADKHVDMSAPSKQGFTPLHIAVINDQKAVVKFLIEQHVNLKAEQPNLLHSMLEAAASKHLKILKMLVDAGADINDKPPPHGNTILGSAIHSSCGNYRVAFFKKLSKSSHTKTNFCQKIDDKSRNVSFLISLGADVNQLNSYGETPLRIAVKLDNISVMKVLLNAGANVNEIRQQSSNNLLMEAIDQYSVYKNTSTIKQLLNVGVDINYSRKNEVYYGGNGCDMNARGKCNWMGQTALIQAAGYGYLPVVKLLLQHGADPYLKEEDGKTAADVALSAGHFKTATLIQKFERLKNLK